jgi:hypothetical protein
MRFLRRGHTMAAGIGSIRAAIACSSAGSADQELASWGSWGRPFVQDDANVGIG